MKNEPRAFKEIQRKESPLAGTADANPRFGKNDWVALGKLLNFRDINFPAKCEVVGFALQMFFEA